MKSCMIRYTAAAAAAAVLLLGSGSQAQSTGAETHTIRPPRNGEALVIPSSETYLALSPETTFFQFRISNRDPKTGRTQIQTINDLGTTLLAEKLFYLRPVKSGGDFSTVSVGGWYWYHNSQADRLALYGKYFYDSHIGFQLNIGGDSHLGLFEYYGFVLYNAKKQTAKSPIGIQLGVGPYFNRRNGQDATFTGGDTGFASLVGLSYAPEKSRLSYSAELRYINYKAPARDLGISTTDSLLRFYTGVTYKL